VVEQAALQGLTVLPFVVGSPKWVAKKETTLPVNNAAQRKAWTTFLKAAVERYGPGGEFWQLHSPARIRAEKEKEVKGPIYEIEGARLTPIAKPVPIRNWQVWNEANFFYFAYPVSPSRYAQLLKLAHGAIKSVDPGAKVVLSGLFGNPDEGSKKGMDATDFLEALYRVPGIKASFDAVALHPYAFHVDALEELVEGVRNVVLENHDPGAGLYITEMGWGSQNDPNVVAFEQGIQGQARELRKAYSYLIANRSQLNLKSTYWFSWKDLQGDCTFCDSVGLFREGAAFKPKPAWRAFVALTGGRARP
jgi:hypothetical protein